MVTGKDSGTNHLGYAQMAAAAAADALPPKTGGFSSTTDLLWY